MSVKMRQMVEREIITRLVADALAAGYTLGVNDGEETTLQRCKDAGQVLSALFTTDEDWLLVYDATGKQIGWVRLIYGNDGWDVISDYTVNLESIMQGANEVSDKYEG
jgi:hypothetical protein